MQRLLSRTHQSFKSTISYIVRFDNWQNLRNSLVTFKMYCLEYKLLQIRRIGLMVIPDPLPSFFLRWKLPNWREKKKKLCKNYTVINNKKNKKTNSRVSKERKKKDRERKTEKNHVARNRIIFAHRKSLQYTHILPTKSERLNIHRGWMGRKKDNRNNYQWILI